MGIGTWQRAVGLYLLRVIAVFCVMHLFKKIYHEERRE